MVFSLVGFYTQATEHPYDMNLILCTAEPNCQLASLFYKTLLRQTLSLVLAIYISPICRIYTADYLLATPAGGFYY